MKSLLIFGILMSTLVSAEVFHEDNSPFYQNETVEVKVTARKSTFRAKNKLRGKVEQLLKEASTECSDNYGVFKATRGKTQIRTKYHRTYEAKTTLNISCLEQ